MAGIGGVNSRNRPREPAPDGTNRTRSGRSLYPSTMTAPGLLIWAIPASMASKSSKVLMPNRSCRWPRQRQNILARNTLEGLLRYPCNATPSGHSGHFACRCRSCGMSGSTGDGSASYACPVQQTTVCVTCPPCPNMYSGRRRLHFQENHGHANETGTRYSVSRPVWETT